MRKIALVFPVLLALALAACGKQGPPTVGDSIAFNAVCDEANDGKRVAVEGFLRLPDSFTGDQSMMLWLYETEDFSGPYIGVSTPIGVEANEVKMVPLEYADEDLQVHLASGDVAGVGTKLKVSGSVYFPLVKQEFACGLQNLLFEPSN